MAMSGCLLAAAFLLSIPPSTGFLMPSCSPCPLQRRAGGDLCQGRAAPLFAEASSELGRTALPQEVFDYLFEQGYGSRERLEMVAERLATPASMGIRVNMVRASTCAIKDEIESMCSSIYGPGFASGIVSHPLVPECILVPPRFTSREASIRTAAAILPHILVGRTCGEALLQGADVFAAGVGTAPANLKVGDKVSVYADCTDTLSRGGLSSPVGSLLPAEAVLVGIGRASMSRGDMFSGARGKAVDLDERLWEAPPMSDFVSLGRGRFMLQALPAMVAARVLAPCPGERVLDMCAAPGGKATHLAEIMGGVGEVVACDRGQSKVDAMRVLAASHGLEACVVPTKADATTCVNDATFDAESFDRVLLDPPCSALGLRPSLRPSDGATVEGLKRHVTYQKKMFKQAVAALKPGGTLVYSTCTINPGENEGIVAWALRSFPCLVLGDQESVRAGGRGLPCCGLSLEESSMVQRFEPGGEGAEGGAGCDAFTGFFIARFEKL